MDSPSLKFHNRTDIKLLNDPVWTQCLPLHIDPTPLTTGTTITTAEFETNGCAAIGYYKEIATWPYFPDEVKTYWYNKDCYEKNFALCQKMV